MNLMNERLVGAITPSNPRLQRAALVRRR